jgi:hypothetical protein
VSSTPSQAADGAVRPGRGAGDGLTGRRPSAAPDRPGLRAGSGGVPGTGADSTRAVVFCRPGAGVPGTGAASPRPLGSRSTDALTHHRSHRSHRRPAPGRAARPAGSVSPT